MQTGYDSSHSAHCMRDLCKVQLSRLHIFAGETQCCMQSTCHITSVLHSAYKCTTYCPCAPVKPCFNISVRLACMHGQHTVHSHLIKQNNFAGKMHCCMQLICHSVTSHQYCSKQHGSEYRCITSVLQQTALQEYKCTAYCPFSPVKPYCKVAVSHFACLSRLHAGQPATILQLAC